MDELKLDTLLIISIVFIIFGIITIALGFMIRKSNKTNNDNSANFVLRGFYIIVLGLVVFFIHLFG